MELYRQCHGYEGHFLLHYQALDLFNSDVVYSVQQVSLYCMYIKQVIECMVSHIISVFITNRAYNYAHTNSDTNISDLNIIFGLLGA